MSPNGSAVVRPRLLLAVLLGVAGLVLLAVGLTIADGLAAWIEVVTAVILLLVSYLLQHLARREIFSRRDDGS